MVSLVILKESVVHVMVIVRHFLKMLVSVDRGCSIGGILSLVWSIDAAGEGSIDTGGVDSRSIVELSISISLRFSLGLGLSFEKSVVSSGGISIETSIRCVVGCVRGSVDSGGSIGGILSLVITIDAAGERSIDMAGVDSRSIIKLSVGFCFWFSLSFSFPLVNSVVGVVRCSHGVALIVETRGVAVRPDTVSVVAFAVSSRI